MLTVGGKNLTAKKLFSRSNSSVEGCSLPVYYMSPITLPFLCRYFCYGESILFACHRIHIWECSDNTVRIVSTVVVNLVR